MTTVAQAAYDALSAANIRQAQDAISTQELARRMGEKYVGNHNIPGLLKSRKSKDTFCCERRKIGHTWTNYWHLSEEAKRPEVRGANQPDRQITLEVDTWRPLRGERTRWGMTRAQFVAHHCDQFGEWLKSGRAGETPQDGPETQPGKEITPCPTP